MYGLETIPFTKEQEGRLDYFQANCYRRILKIQAAFYSRVSNKQILDIVSNHLFEEPGKVSTLSRQVSDRAITLLGHVVRSDENDHSRRIAIDAEFRRVERYKRRVGRPRFYWLQNTMHRAHKLILKSRGHNKVEFDINNREHRTLVAECAQNREHPFDKNRKSKRCRKKRKKRDKEKDRQKEKERKTHGVRNDKFRKNKKTPNNEERRRTQAGSKSEETNHNGNNDNAGYMAEDNGGRKSSSANGPGCRGEASRYQVDLARLKQNLGRFFRTLECEFSFSIKSIKSAYRKVALRTHPDKGGSTEDFQKLGNHLSKITVAVGSFVRKYPQ
jgi:hypothetical protein